MKLCGYLGPAAHHKREMRILNHVLTWRSSETGRAEKITYEGDPRHVDLLLRGHGLEHGKSQEKKSTFRASLPSQKLQEPTHWFDQTFSSTKH